MSKLVYQEEHSVGEAHEEGLWGISGSCSWKRLPWDVGLCSVVLGGFKEAGCPLP